jgi:hypothetical protein
MATYNLSPATSIEHCYQQGLLPQRNDNRKFYQDSSCRSNLANFRLSSENRRILRKTDSFSYTITPIYFNINVQKLIFQWLKKLKWEFPISSVKYVFTQHIFNYLYIWQLENKTVAYSVCFFDCNISHIGYVFYDPSLSHGDLPIRLVLQFVIDSHDKNLAYAYLGRFSPYKKNMPGFEQFMTKEWTK